MKIETIGASGEVVVQEIAPQPIQPKQNRGQNEGPQENTPDKGTESASQVAESTIRNAIDKANHVMVGTKCEFSYHEKTHRVSIRVLDKDTNEVIREIPPEKSLEMLQKMWEMAGLLVDERR